jgi:hypothetical protein
MTPDQTDRLMADPPALLADFYTPEEVTTWLTSPHPHLMAKRPNTPSWLGVGLTYVRLFNA